LEDYTKKTHAQSGHPARVCAIDAVEQCCRMA